jgi:hypothetical protein
MKRMQSKPVLPVFFLRLSLVLISGGVLGSSIAHIYKDFVAQKPLALHCIQRVQLSNQPDHLHNSCWKCIQPNWRRHFIFANSSTGHLEECPDSTSWPVGAWTHPVSSGVSVHAASSVGGTHAVQPLTLAKPAAPGEPAVLPATLTAQKAITANKMSADCRQAKLVVYRAVQRCVVYFMRGLLDGALVAAVKLQVLRATMDAGNGMNLQLSAREHPPVPGGGGVCRIIPGGQVPINLYVDGILNHLHHGHNRGVLPLLHIIVSGKTFNATASIAGSVFVNISKCDACGICSVTNAPETIPVVHLASLGH